ncbi:nitrate- and nitrite sensing domain-containing protein [Sulfurospirillum arsenophilum]|uniref:nitrate- and nitrite sensing domain-containing protein n=1 Tax=Sulfurospirillum arsenophilum TaxID=56698 RepID=UPI0005A64E2B|nr:nitrate- and nitrite sensing domain-containing protein [Sulfurospirillum arsenophilum]
MKSQLNRMLRLISHYPLVLLFVVSSYLLYISYINLDATRKVESTLENTSLLTHLAQTLSKERELSATLLLNSTDSASKEALQTQHVLVNEAMKTFHDFYQTHTLSPNIQSVVAYLTKLAEMRHVVENNTIDFNRMFFDYYAQINRFLYQEVTTLTRTSPMIDGVENLMHTHFILLQHQEYLAQERDFIAKTLTRYLPFESKEVTLWMKMFTATEPFEPSIISDKNVRSQLEKIQQSSEILEMENRLTQSKAEIVTTSQSGDYLTDPYTWVMLLNQKIELFERYAKLIDDARNTALLNQYHQALAQLISAAATWVIAVLLLFAGFIPSNTFSQERAPKNSDDQEDEEALEEEEEEQSTTDTSLYKEVTSSIKNDHITIEEPDEVWEILVCKKSPIETKIFATILSKQCQSVDTALTYCEFHRKMIMNHYGMILFDCEILEGDAEAFLELIHEVEAARHLGHIHTIMFVNPNEQDPLFQPAFDKILANTISKGDLEMLVTSFMTRNGATSQVH